MNWKERAKKSKVFLATSNKATYNERIKIERGEDI